MDHSLGGETDFPEPPNPLYWHKAGKRQHGVVPEVLFG